MHWSLLPQFFHFFFFLLLTLVREENSNSHQYEKGLLLNSTAQVGWLVTQLARISLILSCHSSLSSITPGKSCRLYPVSIQSCCRFVLLGRPTLARPCEEVYRGTFLISSSLLLQQCPACLVSLTCMILKIGGRFPYNCCSVGCCFQDLFSITRSILVQFPSSFFLLTFRQRPCILQHGHK